MLPQSPSSPVPQPGQPPLLAAQRVLSELQRRVRLIARSTWIIPGGARDRLVGGLPMDSWRRFILGWLADRFLERQLGEEAARGARLAIAQFDKTQFRLFVESLIYGAPEDHA